MRSPQKLLTVSVATKLKTVFWEFGPWWTFHELSASVTVARSCQSQRWGLRR